MYDRRTLDRVAQVQHSRMEIHRLDTDGRVTAVIASETDMRWTYMHEMRLLLQLSGFRKWRIDGGFDGRPLALESDLMVVYAWRD